VLFGFTLKRASMLVTVTIPGATTFWLSSPPCDDPTKIAKRNRLQNVHPSNETKIPLRNIRDFGKTTF
jgi:hypothetical protein